MPYRMTPSVRHRAIEVHYYYYYYYYYFPCSKSLRLLGSLRGSLSTYGLIRTLLKIISNESASFGECENLPYSRMIESDWPDPSFQFSRWARRGQLSLHHTGLCVFILHLCFIFIHVHVFIFLRYHWSVRVSFFNYFFHLISFLLKKYRVASLIRLSVFSCSPPSMIHS